MINLIPPFAKKAVVFEYYARVLVVFLGLLICGGIIIGLLTLPTFVLVQLQNTAMNSSYAEIAEDSTSFEEAKKTISAVNGEATFVDEIFSTEPMLPLLIDLQALADREIALAAIQIERGEERAIGAISVRGEAATRESLAAFRDALEADERFVDVVLPLSNLAKNEEVPFSITMNYQLSE